MTVQNPGEHPDLPMPPKAGRPPKAIDYAKVELLAGRGLTKKQIAHCIGLNPCTLIKRRKFDKKLEEAMERGKSKAISACTAKLMSHIEKGNIVGLIFYLKCQAGWKETNILETREAMPIPDDGCSAEEAEAAYIKAMRGG